ncbi:tRNA-specific adenosine deaminase 2 [Strongyloides ratti]|uniref:tRNA-specific adenosine deaminase 2 n=1 Tax=Strongyloides ratti TaxID=34506 RepID=A0A090LAW9_STRRB|nr:tRNA-specific adenosine deaminase 2 [Strongyloides ratti]CEF65248.1 tRNA-specific adenosine deaminase 2 [Strongyloides ratti]
MDEAFILAEKAYENLEVPVGCVLVYKNEIVGRGFNDVNRTKNPTRHAEMVAFDDLREWCKDKNIKVEEIAKSLELYVTLEPCIMCASAMIQLGIKKIVFAASNERFGGIHSVSNISNYGPTKNSFMIFSNIDEERAISLLRKFYDRENVKAPEGKRKLKKI